MTTGTMTSKERTAAAICLGKPDRVPVAPLLTPEPAAQLSGFTKAQVATDGHLALAAFFKTFDEFGGWDAAYGGPITPLQMQTTNIYPMKMRIPGRDLPDDYLFQIVEEEVMKPEDYNNISEMGVDAFYSEHYLQRISDLKRDDVSRVFMDFVTTGIQFIEELGKREIQTLFVAQDCHPFFRLSLMRSLLPFTQDLYYNPEPVERALKRMTEDFITKQVPMAKGSGVNGCLLTEERASGYHYPPSIFERFWWPYTQQIVDAFWSEGIVTLFHLDTCWDKNMPYFKELPKGSAIVGLDSTTNIFQAKEVLRGHLCIYGDVPATLLSIGSPEDVEAYCRKLIDEVGGDGGFILGSGCAVPPDCRPENFRAMIETGKNYELSKI